MADGSALNELLATTAESTPDGVALRAGDDAWSFRELADWSGRLARGLVDSGAQPGDRIAFFLPNCAELVAAYFACFAAGLVAVPLNHRYIAADAGHAIEHSGASVVITHPELVDRLDPLDWAELGVERRHLVGHERDGWSPLEDLEASDPLPPPTIAPTADAQVMYTSGSTGNPKGVVYTHRGLRSLAEAMRAEYGQAPGVVQLLPTPVSHIGGFSNLLACVLGGATVVIGESADPAVVLPLVERWEVELVQLLPTALDDFVEADEHEHHDLSSLRAVTVGGDKVPMDVHRRFTDLTGFEITEGIGMTECSHYACNPPFGEKRLGSAGLPVTGHEVRVVDPDGSDVDTGKTGEILVRTEAMFDRYWENPAATAEVLHGGWLHTGDLGRFDADGWLWFMGRSKQVIIRAGSNIVPEEVEEILYQHPAVRLACVVGAPDPHLGQRVEAYVELEPDVTPSPTGEDLRAFTADRVAGYKVPEHVFVLPELPRTGTGKLDRHLLETRVTEDLR
ncbi:MAG TPA: class I adenylate-forming enzyme family protein [Acidimicrobiia bacterium]